MRYFYNILVVVFLIFLGYQINLSRLGVLDHMQRRTVATERCENSMHVYLDRLTNDMAGPQEPTASTTEIIEIEEPEVLAPVLPASKFP